MPSRKRKQNQWNCFPPKRRSVTGCLSCRRRRKKCDEAKPTCRACIRNFLECIWPQIGSEKVFPRIGSSNKVRPDVPYQLEGPTNHSIEFNLFLLKGINFVKLKNHSLWIFDVLIADPSTGVISRYDSSGDDYSDLSAYESVGDIYDLATSFQGSDVSSDERLEDLDLDDRASCEHLDLQANPFPQIEVPKNALIHYPLDYDHFQEVLGGINLPAEGAFECLFQRCKNKEMILDADFSKIDVESFVLYACIKGYIPKMTTQYTHRNLTTGAAFIPQLAKNPIMREVFLCCGATYLAWNNLQKFQNMSDELYVNCKILIQNFIDKHDNFADEDWLFGALQLLCNRDKNSLTATEDDAKWHLVRAFDIIRLRYYGREAKNFELSIIDIVSNSNLILRPEERTLIESFIFQYSVSILFVSKFDDLPNPFTIFKILNVVLKCRVYNCEKAADWMSNPILGPSLDSFELLAKLSYIGRMKIPLDKEWSERVVSLRNMCDYYTPAAPSKKMTEIQWQNFRINSKAGIITSRACWLFARKLLELDSFDSEDADVQNTVKRILDCCREIPAGNGVWGILPWALLVTGLFSNDLEDRAFILGLNDMMAERAHSYNGFRISTFLRRAWASGNAPNFLFNTNSLLRVNM